MNERRLLLPLLVAWVGLTVYGARTSQAPANEQRAAVGGAIVAGLVIALLGEVAAPVAVGFAGILLAATLLGGPAKAASALTLISSPVHNLVTQKGG